MLEPAPTDFHDLTRFEGRSLLGLYTTITDGVEGTGMAAFGDALSDEDRWALTFLVGSFAVDNALAARGSEALENLPGLARTLDLGHAARQRTGGYPRPARRCRVRGIGLSARHAGRPVCQQPFPRSQRRPIARGEQALQRWQPRRRPQCRAVGVPRWF